MRAVVGCTAERLATTRCRPSLPVAPTTRLLFNPSISHTPFLTVNVNLVKLSTSLIAHHHICTKLYTITGHPKKKILQCKYVKLDYRSPTSSISTLVHLIKRLVSFKKLKNDNYNIFTTKLARKV